jgi:histidyl-tRNA synthetase
LYYFTFLIKWVEKYRETGYNFSMPKKNKLQDRKIKPELPSGVKDYAPEDAILRQRLIGKLRKIFEDFGFDPMETPALERTEVILGGEKESEKIIFNVRGSKDKKYAAPSRRQNEAGLSLRFDLTVPLARFIAANPEIPKPFKRYAIGRVWRGESPQAGRYREFLQADCDIVGSFSMEADAEVISLAYHVFKNFGINKFLIKINNRKVLNGLPKVSGFADKQLPELLRIIDKKDKIGKEEMEKEVTRIFKKSAVKIRDFLAIEGDAQTKLIASRKLFEGDKVVEEGINELGEIARNLNIMGLDQNNWEIDFSIVRGLGYYTGPIFETILLEAKDFGSMASGGRFDNLILPFTGQKIPAVGVSFGIDRLYAAFEKLGILKKKPTTLKVLILNISPELKKEYWDILRALREANINSSLYLGDDHAFQAQLAYAVKKEVPFVIIYGDNEAKKGTVTIKNLNTREQREIPKEGIVKYFTFTT